MGRRQKHWDSNEDSDVNRHIDGLDRDKEKSRLGTEMGRGQI